MEPRADHITNKLLLLEKKHYENNRSKCGKAVGYVMTGTAVARTTAPKYAHAKQAHAKQAHTGWSNKLA